MVGRLDNWRAEVKDITLVGRSEKTMADAMVVWTAEKSVLQPVENWVDERDYELVGCLVGLLVAWRVGDLVESMVAMLAFGKVGRTVDRKVSKLVGLSDVMRVSSKVCHWVDS